MALVKAGHKTALIEREHIGGCCVNVGCTPTKTMVASARAAYLAHRSADYGVTIKGEINVDMLKVRQRKRDIVKRFSSDSEQSIRHAGADILWGEAHFTGPRTLELNGDELTSDWIFINTGARPSVPPLAGLDSVPFLNSSTIMELDEVPRHLLALGGGYVGLEFGQMFRRFGANVTVVQRGPNLLSREDADVADAVADILREDGISVFLNTAATRVERCENDGVRLWVKGKSGERSIDGSHLLVCVGRTPNTDRLNVAAAGLNTDANGYIVTNERLETNVPGVYAIGDVKGGPAFTHISYDDFRIIKANLIDGGNKTSTGRLVPYTVYIDPQLGRVGMSEEDARKDGRQVRVAKMKMTGVARANEVDETRGFMKVIVDAESHQILGGALLGIEGGELMSMLEIAMMGKLPWTALRNAIFAHPTLAEAYNNLFAQLDE